MKFVEELRAKKGYASFAAFKDDRSYYGDVVKLEDAEGLAGKLDKIASLEFPHLSNVPYTSPMVRDRTIYRTFYKHAMTYKKRIEEVLSHGS